MFCSVSLLYLLLPCVCCSFQHIFVSKFHGNQSLNFLILFTKVPFLWNVDIIVRRLVPCQQHTKMFSFRKKTGSSPFFNGKLVGRGIFGIPFRFEIMVLS